MPEMTAAEPIRADNEPTALDVRRRRALWRANHRGTKELDILIGRFAESRLGELAGDDLSRFEDFLAVSDPELQTWLIGGSATADDKFAELVIEVRRFHGLGPT